MGLQRLGSVLAQQKHLVRVSRYFRFLFSSLLQTLRALSMGP